MKNYDANVFNYSTRSNLSYLIFAQLPLLQSLPSKIESVVQITLRHIVPESGLITQTLHLHFKSLEKIEIRGRTYCHIQERVPEEDQVEKIGKGKVSLFNRTLQEQLAKKAILNHCPHAWMVMAVLSKIMFKWLPKPAQDSYLESSSFVIMARGAVQTELIDCDQHQEENGELVCNATSSTSNDSVDPEAKAKLESEFQEMIDMTAKNRLPDEIMNLPGKINVHSFTIAEGEKGPALSLPPAFLPAVDEGKEPIDL